MWFAESARHKIARITPQGTITEFAVPSVPSPAPGYTVLDRLDPSQNAYFRIVRGPDGNLWYTGSGTLGRMSPHGDIREFALPQGSGFITGLTAGPDGNIWFGLSTGKIAKMSVEGKITEFSRFAGRVGELTAGPDGNVWFGVDSDYGSAIGRITPNGVVTEFSFETTYWVNELTAGPDGNVWFSTAAGSVRANEFSSTTNSIGNSIGRITPNGSIKLIAIPGIPEIASSDWEKPYLVGTIAAGPDGNIWFGLNPGIIGRLTLPGKITLIELPHSNWGGVNSMTAGPDGGLWYTFEIQGLFGSIRGTRVGRITP
jgi:virginiamycin B lyase